MIERTVREPLAKRTVNRQHATNHLAGEGW